MSATHGPSWVGITRDVRIVKRLHLVTLGNDSVTIDGLSGSQRRIAASAAWHMVCARIAKDAGARAIVAANVYAARKFWRIAFNLSEGGIRIG